jgi:hypothetical protein
MNQVLLRAFPVLACAWRTTDEWQRRGWNRTYTHRRDSKRWGHAQPWSTLWWWAYQAVLEWTAMTAESLSAVAKMRHKRREEGPITVGFALFAARVPASQDAKLVASCLQTVEGTAMNCQIGIPGQLTKRTNRTRWTDAYSVLCLRRI